PLVKISEVPISTSLKTDSDNPNADKRAMVRAAAKTAFRVYMSHALQPAPGSSGALPTAVASGQPRGTTLIKEEPISPSSLKKVGKGSEMGKASSDNVSVGDTVSEVRSSTEIWDGGIGERVREGLCELNSSSEEINKSPVLTQESRQNS